MQVTRPPTPVMFLVYHMLLMEIMHLAFDGSNDDVNVPKFQEDAINSAISISAWIKPSQFSSGDHPKILQRSEGTGGGVDRWIFNWSPNSDSWNCSVR